MQPTIPPEPETAVDLRSHLARCAAGEGECLRITESKTGASKLPVTGPEVMSPFRNAVRLIHDEQSRLNSLALELDAQSLQPLGRDIQQSKRAILDGKTYRVLFRGAKAAVEAARSNFSGASGFDLILHE